MDQLAIQAIEGFLSVPLIAPETIHPIDARELAETLHQMADEAADADERAAQCSREDLDDDDDTYTELMERLEEVTRLIVAAIKNCAGLDCGDGHPCPTCVGFKEWLDEA